MPERPTVPAHRVELGYPAEIVALAQRSAVDRAVALRAGAEPFGTVYRSWLARIG
jgi:uncharacterized protein